MNKYYAYKGKKNLKKARDSEVESFRFYLGSNDIAIKRCNRMWGENKFKLYQFKDFNNINTFKKII